MSKLDLKVQENLHELVRAIDKTRLLLYPILEDAFPEATPKAGATFEWDEEKRILKFSFPDVPPTLFSKYGDLSDHWLGMYAHIYKTSDLKNYKISFEEAFILIVIKVTNRTIWDVDNRAIKPIINGIRYSCLIPDDDWKHVTFMVTGRLEQKTTGTDVYVTDWHNMEFLLAHLGVKDWPKKVKSYAR